VGAKPEDRGILLDAPGSWILSTLERSSHVDLAKVQLEGLEASLNSGLKSLGVAKIRSLSHEGDRVRIEMELTALVDSEVKLRNLAPRLSDHVGTPVVSAVAAAVSKTTGKYVTIRDAVLDPPNSKVSITLNLTE